MATALTAVKGLRCHATRTQQLGRREEGVRGSVDGCASGIGGSGGRDGGGDGNAGHSSRSPGGVLVAVVVDIARGVTAAMAAKAALGVMSTELRHLLVMVGRVGEKETSGANQRAGRELF